MAHKRIMDIKKISWDKVAVDYFDMKHNYETQSIRKIKYTPKHKEMAGYIYWEGKKKDISALLR